MHFLEATFRTALQNKGYRTPLEISYVNQKENQKTFSVCRDGWNLAKDFWNLGLKGITRYKDHERFFVTIEYVEAPIV